MKAITGTSNKHTHPIQKYTILAFFMNASIPYKKEKCYRNFALFCMNFLFDFYVILQYNFRDNGFIYDTVQKEATTI